MEGGRTMYCYLMLFCLVGLSQQSMNKLSRTRLSSISTSRLKDEASQFSLDNIMNVARRISVQRVPDTHAHKMVQDYIISQFDQNEWYIEKDRFEAETPYGVKSFTNIIATPINDHEIESGNAKGKTLNSIVLAAHYDSKFFEPPRQFVGAVDSAVSCSMMIELARSLTPLLKKNKSKRPLFHLVFFDGEEAFVEWTKDDSLYGSRHLADLWQHKQISGNKTKLETVETLILLDLIGSSHPRFYSYHEDSNWLFEHLERVEERLRGLKRVKGINQYFQPQRYYHADLQDDHIPFLEKGVSSLHLIPIPFPAVWHTDEDTPNRVDTRTVEDLTAILRVFLIEYLHL